MKVDYKLYKMRIRYLVFLTIIYSNIVISHIISYDINIIYFKLLQFDPFVHFLCKVVGVGGPFYEIKSVLVPAFYSEVILAAICIWSELAHPILQMILCDTPRL